MEFTVQVLPRKIRGIKLCTDKGRSFLLPFEDKQTYHLPRGKYQLESILATGDKNCLLPIINGVPMDWREKFTLSQNQTTRLKIYNANSFYKLGEVAFSCNKFN